MISSPALRAHSADKLAPDAAPVVRSPAVRHAFGRFLTFVTTGEQLYWLCQFVSWTFFFFVNIVLVSAFTEVTLQLTAWTAIYMLVGMLLTQRLRLHIRRAGWVALRWQSLVGRALVAIVGMSTVHTSITVLASLAFLTADSGTKVANATQLLGIVFMNLVNMSIVFGVWTGLYFAVQNVRRQRQVEFERLRLETSLKEAELRALKSQVNPHFLFNSLNSLRALIDEDAPRAREAVTRLANMLRYSLQSGQLETVPFEDELRIVADYLALEQIRHESRLRVRWSVADDVRACGVPPMLLQTLVENAVKYGIGTRRDGGEISISAALADRELTISVTNPGNLSGPASTAAARAGSSTGVGLRNASERLKLLFGGRAQLTLTEAPVGFVTAAVRIPCNVPCS
jgi:hypothetical protein